ncbi:MAG: hypothetical protein JWN14_2673, partial [Chthonomonadales bacterium]|nr:hypothetical protein [Chthonomonadales bacterium]
MQEQGSVVFVVFCFGAVVFLNGDR